jgi:Tol biopolymer transport system component
MLAVIRRVMGVGSLLLALVAAEGAALAQEPAGPRLSFVRLTLEPPRIDLLSIGPRGESPRRIVPWKRVGLSAAPLDAPTWSADGATLVFIGEVGGRSDRVFTVGTDGKAPALVSGTGNASHPVISPDGQTIAFARTRVRRKAGRRQSASSDTSVWLADRRGGRPRLLIPAHNGLATFPSSFSPDGSTLAMWREEPGKSPQAIALNIATGQSAPIVSNAGEPVYSPDGSRIAFVRPQKRPRGRLVFLPGTDVYVTDGSVITRLTNTPGRREVWPGWDPSGERLLFTQLASKLSLASLVGLGNSVMEVNADGTCRSKLIAEPRTAFYGTAWMPGVDRGLGRILC